MATSKLCTFTVDGTNAAGSDIKDYVHAGEIDWTAQTGSTGTGILTADSRLRAGTGTAVYYADAVPDSADYTVMCPVRCLSTPANASQIGIAARIGTGAFTGYYLVLARVGTDTKLMVYRGGNGTPIISKIITNPSDNTTHTMALATQTSGSDVVVSVYWDGVQYTTTATGANAITDVGRPGIVTQIGGTPSDSTGWHIDDFAVAEQITPAANQFSYNQRDGTGNPTRDCEADLVLTTDAASINIVGTTTIYAASSAASKMGVFINGVAQTALAFSADATQRFTVTLGTAGTSRTVTIRDGAQSKPNAAGSVLGSWLQRFTLVGETEYAIAAKVTSGITVTYGDSIVVGDSATDMMYGGWPVILRDSHGKRVRIDAWGANSLSKDTNYGNSTAVAALAARLTADSPDRIYLSIGSNDFGLNYATAVDFGTYYAALLVAIKAAQDGCKIYAITPIIRGTEDMGEEPNVRHLDDYRDAIVTAATGKAYVTVIDGKAILELSDMAEASPNELHPTSAGHVKLADAILATYAATGYTLSRDPATAPLNGTHVITATVTPNGPYTGTITITPSGVACSAAVTLTFTNSAVAQTAEFTVSATGTLTLTGTNNGSLTNPAAVTVQVTAGPPKFVAARMYSDRVRVFFDQNVNGEPGNETWITNTIAKFALTVGGEAATIYHIDMLGEGNGNYVDLYRMWEGDGAYLTPASVVTVARTQGSDTGDIVGESNETAADFTAQTATWASRKTNQFFLLLLKGPK